MKNYPKIFENTPTCFAVCLTVYNEPLENVMRTISSLNTSNSYASRGEATGGTVVFVLIDGVAAADPELIDVMGRGAQVFDLSEIVEGVRLRSVQIEETTSDDFSVIAVLKDENQGKLHSHRLFYTDLCPKLSPDYCIQIDAGTVVAEDCLFHMQTQFEENETAHVGVGTSVEIEPKNSRDLLYFFQKGEFHFQRAISWSAEQAMGCLSILPGQCSAIRWSAFVARNGSGTSARDRYLRATETLNPFQKIMYLAEDRIMTLELASNTWATNKITYSTKALTTTDACETFDELLRQRRRWINSIFACRIWMIGFLLHAVVTRPAPLGKRLSTLVYIGYAAMACLIEFLLPAIAFGVIGTIIVGAYQYIPSHLHAEMNFLLGAMASMAAFPLIAILSKKNAEVSDIGIKGAMCVAVFVFVLGLAQFIHFALESGATAMGANSVSAVLYILASVMLLATYINMVICAVATPTAAGRGQYLYTLGYVMMALVMNLYLVIYAVLNLSDTSWGTKGLRNKDAFGTENKSNRTFAGLPLTSMAKGVLVLWIVSNVALAAFVPNEALFACVVVFLFGLTSFAMAKSVAGVFARQRLGRARAWGTNVPG